MDYEPHQDTSGKSFAVFLSLLMGLIAVTAAVNAAKDQPPTGGYPPASQVLSGQPGVNPGVLTDL